MQNLSPLATKLREELELTDAHKRMDRQVSHFSLRSLVSDNFASDLCFIKAYLKFHDSPHMILH